MATILGKKYSITNPQKQAANIDDMFDDLYKQLTDGVKQNGSEGDIVLGTDTGDFSFLPAVVSGKAVISQGIGVDPAWGKIGLTTHVDGVLPTANGGTGGLLTVDFGGTGRASHTAYAVICGGTTGTGAQQSIASVGSSGQVLTSNGAAALPTFQTPAASGGSAFTAPVDGEFAWINQGGSTVVALDSTILLTAPATAGDSLRIRKQAANATPWVLTVNLLPVTGKQTTTGATYGIGFRQSSDGKLHVLLLNQIESGGTIYSIKFTNETTFSATYTSTLYSALNVNAHIMPIRWLRIADDGANRICSYSFDGITWVAFHTVARTDFLTADETLFFANASDAGVATTVRLYSWAEA